MGQKVGMGEYTEKIIKVLEAFILVILDISPRINGQIDESQAWLVLAYSLYMKEIT